MLPGRQYTPDDIINILWRRAWMPVAAALVAAVCGAVFASRLPVKYRSESLVQLLPQRIPDNIVRPAVNAPPMGQRLVSLRQAILSRSQLERIIQEFNLYPDLRGGHAIEEAVEQMREDDIEITVETGDAFRVAYISDDPETAQKVAARLASLFVDQNAVGQIGFVEQTSQFLDARLEEARQRLIEHEKKLEEYRRRHANELPSQVQSNLAALQNARTQLQVVADAMNRDRDRRLALERQIADLVAAETFAPPPAPPAPSGDGPVGGRTTLEQLESAKAALQALQVRYKDDHPDVGQMKRRIRDLEAQLQAELATRPAPAGETERRPATAAEALRQKQLRDYRAELQNLDRQIEAKLATERQLRDTIDTHQARVAAAPTREAEMTELMRDYSILQESYNTLRRKREEASLSEGVVRQQIGEQFRVLDPARVPNRPFSPKRWLIIAAAAALGFGLGVGVIGLIEYRDSTFRTEDEVVRLLQLPVLAFVPTMTPEREIRARHRRNFVVAVAAVLLTAATVAAVWVWRFQSAAGNN